MSFARSTNHFYNGGHVFLPESELFGLPEEVLRGRGRGDINAELGGGGTGVAEVLGHEAEEKIHLVRSASHSF